MPCNLDEMLHFKSNSSPEGVYLPGYYPYPEHLRVLYNIQTRLKHFFGFCTTLIPVPELLEHTCDRATIRGVWVPHLLPARNVCKYCTPVPQYPEILEIL